MSEYDLDLEMARAYAVEKISSAKARAIGKAIARAFKGLKAGDIGEMLGSGGRAAYRGGKRVVEGTGNFGAGAAKAMGLKKDQQGYARRIAQGGLGLAALKGADSARHGVNNFRQRHNFGGRGNVNMNMYSEY